MRLGWTLGCALVAGCGPTDPDAGPPGPTGPTGLAVTDAGRSSGYQEHWFGHYNRGRGAIVADFDGDGDPDVFSGNPGGESFVILNHSTPGALAFEPGQVLSTSELFYGGVAADFDDDGDPDLFVATGANDGYEADRLFRNDGGSLVDISDTLELVPRASDGSLVPNGSMGVRAFDADLDGDLDLWVDNFGTSSSGPGPAAEVLGRNQLYLNEGGLQLVDRAPEIGLDHQASSRHSVVFDFDRDGDLDVFENNYREPSVLWRNRVVEDGVLRFENVTAEMGIAGTQLAGSPVAQAMCALSADLDNDGWEDLLVLNRGMDDPGAIHGHFVYMNHQGRDFFDVGPLSNLSADFDERAEATTTGPIGDGWGVMGCQVGDLDLDGFPDVFIGAGAGATGGVNRLFLSDRREVYSVEGVDFAVPLFEDRTDLTDFPARPVEGAPEVPYPYRTHGSAIADFDGDGIPELAEHNGGPADFDFREPNRLWVFHHPDPRYLRVELRGDGQSVSRDPFGSRVRVTVERDIDGESWELHQTLHGGSGFGAQNEAVLTFGLDDGDRVAFIEVRWPDGSTSTPSPPDGARATLRVER